MKAIKMGDFHPFSKASLVILIIANIKRETIHLFGRSKIPKTDLYPSFLGPQASHREEIKGIGYIKVRKNNLGK